MLHYLTKILPIFLKALEYVQGTWTQMTSLVTNLGAWESSIHHHCVICWILNTQLGKRKAFQCFLACEDFPSPRQCSLFNTACVRIKHTHTPHPLLLLSWFSEWARDKVVWQTERTRDMFLSRVRRTSVAGKLRHELTTVVPANLGSNPSPHASPGTCLAR